MSYFIRIDDVLGCIEDAQDGSKGTYDILADVFNRVLALPSEEPKTKWIPCSERLPEIYTPVILSGKYNEVIGYRRNDSDWMALTGDGWETDIEHPEDFIAWMPLPEPYGEESEVGE